MSSTSSKYSEVGSCYVWAASVFPARSLISKTQLIDTAAADETGGTHHGPLFARYSKSLLATSEIIFMAEVISIMHDSSGCSSTTVNPPVYVGLDPEGVVHERRFGNEAPEKATARSVLQS